MEEKRIATHHISKLSNRLRRELESLVFCRTYSGAQGRTLHFILANSDKDLFQKDIEEEYGLRPPTASELLKKMEQNGLIYREPSVNDARLKKIMPSEKALQHQEEVVRDLAELEEKLIKGISEEDLVVFFRVTEKMIKNIS